MKDPHRCTDPTWVATGCQGKDQLTRQQAQNIAAAMRHRSGRGAVSAYRCGACGSWHVGSSKRKRTPAVPPPRKDTP